MQLHGTKAYLQTILINNVTMAANGISTLALKRDRQNAKLSAATTKRGTDGRNNTLTITDLPTLYDPVSNTNPLVDNPNAGGLVAGRPWS